MKEFKKWYEQSNDYWNKYWGSGIILDKNGKPARMVESVDTPDSSPGAERREGSNPSAGIAPSSPIKKPERCPECGSDDPFYMPGGWTRTGQTDFDEWVPCPDSWHQEWHQKDAYENAKTMRYIAEGRYQPGMIVQIDWRNDDYDYQVEWGEIVDPVKEGWTKPGSYFRSDEKDIWTKEDDARFIPIFSYASEGRTGGYTYSDLRVMPSLPQDVIACPIAIGNCPKCGYYDHPENDYICSWCRFGSPGLLPTREN